MWEVVEARENTYPVCIHREGFSHLYVKERQVREAHGQGTMVYVRRRGKSDHLVSTWVHYPVSLARTLQESGCLLGPREMSLWRRFYTHEIDNKKMCSACNGAFMISKFLYLHTNTGRHTRNFRSLLLVVRELTTLSWRVWTVELAHFFIFFYGEVDSTMANKQEKPFRRCSNKREKTEGPEVTSI